MPVDPSVVMIQRNLRPLPACAAWLLLALCLASLSSSAPAQEYRSDPIDKEASRNKLVVLPCVRGNANYATESEKFLNYFAKCFFPEMTRTESESLAKLGPNRFDLFRKTLWATSNEALQSDLTAEAFKNMQRIVVAKDPPYHPAVRYNAVLVIGMLDEQYAIDGGANARPPKPLPQANAFLVQVVNLGAEGKAVPPSILAGALVGLDRHARFRDGLPREAIEPMTAAVLKIATQEKPPLEMDSQVFAWMRLQAANILAQLGGVGTNNQVHDAIVKLVADGRSLDDRCAAAALTAKIKYGGAKVDGDSTAEKMLKLASDLAEAEAKRAIDFEDTQYAGGGGAAYSGGERGPGGYGGGERGYSGGMAMEEQEDPYPRRHVLTRLTDMLTGLDALKPVVPADAQTKFDAIIAAVKPAIIATSNKDTVSLKVAQAVRTMADTVRSVAGPAKDAAAAEADDAAVFDAPAAAPAEAPAGQAPAETPAAADTPVAEPSAETPPAGAVPAEAPPAETAQ